MFDIQKLLTNLLSALYAYEEKMYIKSIDQQNICLLVHQI